MGKCYCLADLHSAPLSNRMCNFACPGNPSQLCGGRGVMSVFNLKNSTGIRQISLMNWIQFKESLFVNQNLKITLYEITIDKHEGVPPTCHWSTPHGCKNPGTCLPWNLSHRPAPI